MFDVQRFGDNDTVTSSYELQLVYKFTDGDTRTTTLPNPRTNLSSDAVITASNTLNQTQAFLGDKNDGAFDEIASAVIVSKTRRKLDLT